MDMKENNKYNKTSLPKRNDVIINEITKKISELCNDTQNIENNLYFINEEEKEKGDDVIGNAIRDVFLEYHKYFIHLLGRENNFSDSDVIDNEFVTRILDDSIFCNSSVDVNNIVERYNLTIDKKNGNNLKLSSSLSSSRSISSSSSSSSSSTTSTYHTTSSNTNTPNNKLKLNDLASKVADEILRKMPSQDSSNEMLKALMREISNLNKEKNLVNTNQQIDTGVQTLLPPPSISTNDNDKDDTLNLNKNDNLPQKKELKNIGLQTSTITTTTSIEKISLHSNRSQDTLSSSYIPSNILNSLSSRSTSTIQSPGQVNINNLYHNNDFIVYEVDNDGSICNVRGNDNVYNLDDISKIKRRYSPIHNHEMIKKSGIPIEFDVDRERCILKMEEICLDSTDNENIIDYSNITSKDETSVCSKNKNIKTFLDNNGSTTTTLSSISTIPNSI